MAKQKLLCTFIGFILCVTACSSSSRTESIETPSNVPTSLDGRAKAVGEARAKSGMDFMFTLFDITPPDPSLDGQAFIRAFSIYREYVANIDINTDEAQFQDYDITLDVLRDYLVELVAAIDGVLDAVISGNQSSISVADGKFTYLISQFPILKNCLMDLRSDC